MSIQQITMTVPQWSAVLDNPIQRDTERHAKKARRGHLGSPSIAQSVVHAANVRGVGLVKLDGHTRSLLWDRGELESPASIKATVFDVNTMDEAIALYKTFDGKAATEGVRDILHGAYRVNGIDAASDALIQGGVTSALQILCGPSSSAHENVAEFKSELQLIDLEGWSKNKMVAPLLAAAIIGLRRHGDIALQYFREYCSGTGVKNGTSRDTVEALNYTIQCRREKRQMGGGNHPEICAIALNGMERYRAGMNDVRGSLRALDLSAYIKEAMKIGRG